MIRLCAPEFDARDRARVDAVLDSGMLVQGAMVAELEQSLARFLGTPAVACSNGTAALHLALMALDIGPGDEVVLPAFTWPSAANAIVRTGATPVFVDIDPDTLNLDPARVEAAMGPRTRALLPIHQFGIPAPMPEIMALARSRALLVVEDAACAIGTECDGGLAGTIGTLGCFSFHPRKVVTTGEGGAIVAGDSELRARLERLRNHGQDTTRGLDRFVDAGLNYRMPELCAAIGIGQVGRLPEILRARRRLAALYVRLLASVDGLRVPAGVADPRGNAQSFVVDVGSPVARERLMADCAAAEIQTTIGTYSAPGQPAYAPLGVDPRAFPVANAAAERLMTLPLHPEMSDGDVERVVSVLDESCRSSKR